MNVDGAWMAGNQRRRGKQSAEQVNSPAPRKWMWFRNDQGARLKAKEEFEKLPVQGQAGLAKKIERYLQGESRYKDIDSVGDGILELRHRHLNNQYRVLFMLWGPHCVALTAFYKNQQEIPRSDIDRAERRADRWRQVFGKEPPA